MKFLFQIVKLLFSICLLQGAIANAATEAQINTLIDNLDIQKAIKTQALDLNRYEIEKRSPTQTPKQQEQFKELVAFMEKKLDWAEIGPDLISTYSQNFDDKQVAVLNQFLTSPAGKVYKDQYQYMALPYKIMLDEYIDQLIETFFDNPSATLPKVTLSGQNEKKAYELISLLTHETRDIEFAASSKSLNEIVQKGTKANKKQMNNFNSSFSLEQIKWRSAKVLADKISVEDINTLLVALKDKKLQNSLKDLDVVTSSYSNYLQQKFMQDQEFLGFIQKTLDSSSSD